jgi:hypothetical protein
LESRTPIRRVLVNAATSTQLPPGVVDADAFRHSVAGASSEDTPNESVTDLPLFLCSKLNKGTIWPKSALGVVRRKWAQLALLEQASRSLPRKLGVGWPTHHGNRLLSVKWLLRRLATSVRRVLVVAAGLRHVAGSGRASGARIEVLDTGRERSRSGFRISGNKPRLLGLLFGQGPLGQWPRSKAGLKFLCSEAPPWQSARLSF